jgi:xylulose-5-phosphate/fructose-6-phosphate phosphoketolase
MSTGTRTPELLRKMDAYWRAANYLSVGQIYLRDNPLLREPLKPAHVKAMLLGHWGTTPGQNFIYVHLNRVIREQDLDMIYISGPGHGGPALVGNTYLEGTYSEIYPDISQDEAGLEALQAVLLPRRHSQPCLAGMPRFHPRGRRAGLFVESFLRRGVRQSRPDRRLRGGRRRSGDRTARHLVALEQVSQSRTDGAVLPILHFNGYKIANPTVLARIEPEELDQFLRGCGWTPHFVEGDEPALMHQAMAATLDTVVAEIKRIQHEARATATPCARAGP